MVIPYLFKNKKMNYYKLSTDTPIGKKLSDLFAEGRRCDEEANKLAHSLLAVSYLISPEADFGGIDVVEFAGDYLPNATLWELIHNEEGLRSYVPKVELKPEYVPVEQAEALREAYGKIVSKQEVHLPGSGVCLPVMSISGSRKAVQLYKRIQALPIVPLGTIAHLLGINDSNNRPGMLEKNGYIFIQTKHYITVDGIEIIGESDFRKIVDDMKKQR